MEKIIKKYFCNCCGRKLDFNQGQYITDFEVTFMGKWYDKCEVVESHDELKRSNKWRKGYRNILPENNDDYTDDNHSIYQDGGSTEVYHIEADMICKSCATKIIDKLSKVRDELHEIAASPKELEDDNLEKFSTEQLLEEIKKRTSSKEEVKVKEDDEDDLY